MTGARFEALGARVMGLYRTAVALALVVHAEAWNDIAGALTYKGTSHVFQVRATTDAARAGTQRAYAYDHPPPAVRPVPPLSRSTHD